MNRGEIWLLNLDPTMGAEIQKTRPVVIISSDAVGILPLRVVVPLTHWKDHYRSSHWLVRVQPDRENGLEKPSAADTFQIRSVSTSRFVRKIGVMGEQDVRAIGEAVGLVIEI